MTRFALPCGLFFLLVFQILAAGVSGKWSGTIAVKDESSGAVIDTPIEIQLSQQGSIVSGKIGRAKDADSVPIRNVRFEGGRIYFEAESGETTGPCKFTLTVAGDTMEGGMTCAIESADISGKVKVTRVER